jgi:hypothetical protein
VVERQHDLKKREPEIQVSELFTLSHLCRAEKSSLEFNLK